MHPLPRPAAGSLRVMTWNVWWRFGPWEQRQSAIAETIGMVQPDILGLQETFGGDPSQVEQLLDDPKAGFAGFHAVTTIESDPATDDAVPMGNALVSRWPITEVERQVLPMAPGHAGRRTALHALVLAPSGPVPVTVTHLAWEYDESATRVEQVRAIAASAAARRRRFDPSGTAFPPVLVGDLNATPDSDEIRLLTGRAAGLERGLVFIDAWPAAPNVDRGDGITWHRANPYLADAAWPQRRLDYVLVGWPRPKPAGSVLGAHVVGDEPVNGVVPSDHYGVVVDLHFAT